MTTENRTCVWCGDPAPIQDWGGYEDCMGYPLCGGCEAPEGEDDGCYACTLEGLVSDAAKAAGLPITPEEAATDDDGSLQGSREFAAYEAVGGRMGPLTWRAFCALLKSRYGCEAQR